MDNYKLFWGDSHLNLHSRHMNAQTLQLTLAQAREMIDFFPMAYYPVERHRVKGFGVEDYLPDDVLQEQWRMICRFAATNNRPGELVIFPGYEWQGSGVSGDHNVSFLEDHPPLIRCETLTQLYDEIRRRGLSAYAIPHHTAYKVGIRAKDWSVHDPLISPCAEIFSHHGSSESDEQCPGLFANRNMGPGTAGGTIEDGLARGLKFGIIASGDTHSGTPGVYGHGLMACWAEQLTRTGIWSAIAARRVYGVTSDRIELQFGVEGAEMGRAIDKKGPVHITASVCGGDAVDRIELLRNNRVIATHCHNGTWVAPGGDEPVRLKLRVECGWGARTNEIPDFGPRDWHCRIEVPNGQILAVEKCWRHTGQQVGAIDGSSCDFHFHTPQQEPTGDLNMQGNIFEILTRPADAIRLIIEGKTIEMTAGEAMAGSRIVDFIDEASRYVQEHFALDPQQLPRVDRLYYTGHKAKIHRAIPEVGYTGHLDWTDHEPPVGVNHYRVRISQRNGAMAWSSPIWVTN